MPKTFFPGKHCALFISKTLMRVNSANTYLNGGDGAPLFPARQELWFDKIKST
jgi:hypothetical protein